jgi:hypothetical protein
MLASLTVLDQRSADSGGGKRLRRAEYACTLVQSMAAAITPQLLLLDESLFAKRPARDPRTPRQARAEVAVESLALEFSVSSREVVSPALRSDEARQLAVQRSRARLLAKLEGRVAPLQRQAPGESTSHDGTSHEVAEAVVFLLRRKTTSTSRAAMVRAFADRLEGESKRSDTFELRAGAGGLMGQIDMKALTVRFLDTASRRRWIGVIQRLAREHDLVEAE